MSFADSAVYNVGTDDDVMTVAEFKENCECGFLSDDDGYGYAIRGDTSVTDPKTEVLPSQKRKVPDDITHVVWFNR